MSENTENKLLTLDHVKVLKDYIDVNNDNIKYYVDTSTNGLQNNLDNMSAETKALLLSEISKAENNLKTSYQDKYDDLIEQIKDAKANGNQAAIDEILLKLQALETDKNRKDAVLETLENAINGIKDSIFNAGEIYELINTALIDSVTITDEAVLTPEMYAGKLVAFIASFGEVKAEKIIGGAIVGHTITNTNNNWHLDEEGSGYLANGNIRWDEDGNVTFGSDVKLGWDLFDDTVTNNLSEMLENLHGSKLSVENLIDQWLDDNNISVNEVKQIQNLLIQINKERAMIETSVHNMIDNLNNIKIVVPKVEEFEDPEDNTNPTPEDNTNPTPEDNTNPTPEDNTNPTPEDNKDDIIIEEEEEEEEVVDDETPEIDYSTEPWAKMKMGSGGSIKASRTGGTYWFDIPIHSVDYVNGISYTDYINSYIPKYGHYIVIDKITNIDADNISMYVKTSKNDSREHYELYYHVVIDVPPLRTGSVNIKDRNIQIRLVSNIPVDQTSKYWYEAHINIYQSIDNDDNSSEVEFYPVAASNSDVIVESDSAINSFDINLRGVSPINAESVLKDFTIATSTPWINIIDSKYDNDQKLTVTYGVGANISENTRTGQIFLEIRDPANQWVPIHNTVESINIVQHGCVVVDIDTQAAVDELKSEIAKRVKSLETELNAYRTAVDRFVFDVDNNSNTDLRSIISRWIDISELITNPYRVLPLSDGERDAMRAAAAEYNDKYVSIMAAYNDSVNFLAEITGKISELKINNVRKTLNNLATDYSKLKDITNKTFIISEAYINAMADDGLLSPAEIIALRQKYGEISQEYLAIEPSVNTLIDAYYNACWGEQANASIDKELKSYYEQLCSCYDTYKNTYEDVRIIFDYYTDDTKHEKDEFGNVKIVDEYDINSIPKLYEARQTLLNIYYAANSFYTTYNRFGSKTTYIGEDGLYSGTIMADNLRGWCIEGLSMQSSKDVLLPKDTEWYKYNKDASNENEAFEVVVSDGKDLDLSEGPAWQINRDGTGYLASGKFKWGTDEVTIGDMIIKLDDTETNLDTIIKDINNLLENIGNDNHVDESERRTLSMIKASIMREYSSTCGAIDEIRIKFGDKYPAATVKLNILYSNETQYATAYNKAIDVIIYYESNNDIISSKPLSLISDYYNAYDVVCKSIQKCNLLYADLVAQEVENSVNTEIQKAVARINRLTDNVAALSGMLDETSGGVITWLNQWCADNSLNSQEINDLKIKWAECDKEYSIINDTVASTIKSLNDTLIDTEGLTSDIINDYISGLTTKYNNFTTEYEKLKVTCEHYIKVWDDLILSNNTGNDIENGTVPTESLNMFIEIDNVNYPIAVHFGDYNGAKTDLVNYHNEAASFITSYHRFGSKLTYIGEDGIYSGTITGDQITGARISGLTFESSKTCKLPKGVGFIKYTTNNNGNIIDLNGEYISNNDNDEGTDGPAWQIDKNGNGHLANGQIHWEGDKVYFGDNVELKWNSDWDNKLVQGGGGLSETEVNNLIATQITNSGITADTIEGKTVKSVDGKWELNRDGSGYLGNFDGVKAIEWDADGVKIQGTNVEIDGDVKINGAAIMDGIKDGIENDDNVQKDFETLVADHVNVDSIAAKVIESGKIKTDSLETKPDGTDKVHIEDNYIHCITSNGDKTLIISSNDVDPGELDTLFNPNSIINDNVVTDISFNATTTYQGTTYACNSSIWRSSDSVTNNNLIVNYGYTENGDPINIETSGSKIGYICENGKINANISLTLYDVSNTSFNPNTSTSVLLKDWVIAQQSPITNGWGVTNNGTTVYPSVSPVLPTTYIVGGDDTYPGATSYTIGRILIYRSDTNNGIYYKYTEQEILGIAKWGEKIPGQVRTLTINDIELADPGYYAVELCFNPNSFILLTSTTATNKNYYMHGGITTTIAQDAPANYMKIGKNGLVAFNGSTGFSIDDNNITMRTRNNNNFYGIKIAPSGIYIGDGNTTWKRLDTTKLFELLSTTTTTE